MTEMVGASTNVADVSRLVTVIHLVAASTGEQRFERDASNEQDALQSALKFAGELLSNGEPVTLWRTSELRSASTAIQPAA